MSIQAINILDKKGNVIINRGFGEKKFEGLVDQFLQIKMTNTLQSERTHLIDYDNQVIYNY